jgi:hypothetical protein
MILSLSLGLRRDNLSTNHQPKLFSSFVEKRMQLARRKRLAQAGAAAIEQMRRAAWAYDQWLVMA